MNIYLENGYMDMAGICKQGYPFTMVCNGRGTGKTYGMLKYLYESRTPYDFMRRTQTQVDMVKTQQFNPYKKLNRDNGWNIQPCPINGGLSGFYEVLGYTEKNKPIIEGPPLGVIMALSTVSNLRGFDQSDRAILFYDEFIPEPQEKPIKREAEAFFNAYETINRNRELDGDKPLQAVLCSNSNDMGNPIFVELGLVTIAEKMLRKGNEVYTDEHRGILLIIPRESEISKQKENTALYRLAEKTAYNKMALKNEFVSNDMSDVKVRSLKEYRPLCIVGELCIYRHKSRNVYYVTTHASGSPERYCGSDVDLARFRKKYYWLWTAYLDGKIDFEEYLCVALLTKYMRV